MDDPMSADKLKTLIMAALAEADGQGETLIACLLAQALDTIERRPGAAVIAGA